MDAASRVEARRDGTKAATAAADRMSNTATESQGRSDESEAQGLSKNHADYVSTGGAKSYPNADFFLPLIHDEREHTINTREDEDHGQRREGSA